MALLGFRLLLKSISRKFEQLQFDIWLKFLRNCEAFILLANNELTKTLLKSVRIWSFSGPFFPAFGLTTEISWTNLHIHSEYRKIRTRKTPNKDTFYAVKFKEEQITKSFMTLWPVAWKENICWILVYLWLI